MTSVRTVREEIVRGDTNVIPFPSKDRSGRLIPLVDSVEVTFTAKKSYADDDADAVIQVTKAGGQIISYSDVSLALGEVILEPSDTSSLLPVVHHLVYTIKVVEPSGTTTSVQGGTLVVVPDATNT
jgi:hypothetical protein